MSPKDKIKCDVEEYLRLTDEIRKLTIRRKVLGELLPHGRNEGIDQDVCVSMTTSSVVSMIQLRKFVTQEIINRCTSLRDGRKVAVMPKLKGKTKTEPLVGPNRQLTEWPDHYQS